MSVRQIERVLKHSRATSGPTQLVALIIASYAADDGAGAWPSIRTIAAAGRISAASVKRAIAELQRLGDLRVDRGGGNRSSRYALTVPIQIEQISTPVQPDTGITLTPPPVQPDTAGVSERDWRGFSLIPDPSVTRHETRQVTRQSAHDPLEARFETFWTAYPRKVAKDAARKAWNQRKPTEALMVDILAAIARQTLSAQWQRDGGQFIPHPATWLRQGRWQDEGIAAPSARLSDAGATSVVGLSAFRDRARAAAGGAR